MRWKNWQPRDKLVSSANFSETREWSTSKGFFKPNSSFIPRFLRKLPMKRLLFHFETNLCCILHADHVIPRQHCSVDTKAVLETRTRIESSQILTSPFIPSGNAIEMSTILHCVRFSRVYSFSFTRYHRCDALEFARLLQLRGTLRSSLFPFSSVLTKLVLLHCGNSWIIQCF